LRKIFWKSYKKKTICRQNEYEVQAGHTVTTALQMINMHGHHGAEMTLLQVPYPTFLQIEATMMCAIYCWPVNNFKI